MYLNLLRNFLPQFQELPILVIYFHSKHGSCTGFFRRINQRAQLLAVLPRIIIFFPALAFIEKSFSFFHSNQIADCFFPDSRACHAVNNKSLLLQNSKKFPLATR